MWNLPLSASPTIVPLICGGAFVIVNLGRILRSRIRGEALADYRRNLESFSGVWILQMSTDKYHEAALLRKIFYQGIGLTLALVAPIAIVIASWNQSNHGHPADKMWEFISIALVVGAILLFKNPTKGWARARMQSEVLRLHTHLCLALLPPYADRVDVAEVATVISSVELARIEELRAMLVGIANNLREYVVDSTNPRIDSARADAYDRERIQEQLKYFRRSFAVVSDLLLAAGKVLRGSLKLALLISFALWLIAGRAEWHLLEAPLELLLRVSVAAVTFSLTLRAVLGWESRLGVYGAMNVTLDSWRNSRARLAGAAWGNVADIEWQRDFRSLSRDIEVAMADEALAWLTAVEREVYEAPI